MSVHVMDLSLIVEKITWAKVEDILSYAHGCDKSDKNREQVMFNVLYSNCNKEEPSGWT